MAGRKPQPSAPHPVNPVHPVENSGLFVQDEQDSEMEERELTARIIGCAMKVHSALGPGFLESVYSKALAHELRKAGLKVESEKTISVKYDGVVFGDF